MSSIDDHNKALPETEKLLSGIAFRYKAIFDSNMDAVICMGADGKIFSWNPQAEKLFGWPVSEINGKTVAETIIPPQYRERHIKGLQHYFDTGEGPYLNRIIEISAISRSGHQFPIELTIIPLAEEGLRFFCAFIRDITIRKNAEASIQLSYQRLKDAETIGKTGYWHWDLASGLVSWSAGTYVVFGEEEGKFKGNFDDFIRRVHIEDRDKIIHTIKKVLEIRQSTKYEFWIETPSGEKKFISTTASVIPDDNGNIASMFGTTHDNTERKIAQEKEYKHHHQQQILARLNEAVNRVQAPEEIYELAIDTLHNTLNVGKTSILLFDSSNVMRFVASRNLTDEYKRVAEGHSPWSADEQNAKPIFVQDVTQEQGLRQLLPAILKEHINALGFIPLIHQNKLLGKFMVYFTEPHHFEEEEIRIMQSIASIVAFAIWEKKSAIALRDSEEKYRAFFENSLDGILITKTDGTILAANSAACRMFDRTEEELCKVGRDGIADFSDPRMKIILEERKQRGKVTGEMNFLRKNGTKFPGEISSTAFIDASGSEITVTIIRDITIRKKSEDQLRKSEEQYRDLVDNITDLICTHDLNGRVLSVNKAAEKLMGYEFNPNAGLNIRDILSAGAAKQFDSYMKNIISKGWASGIMKVKTRTGETRIWEYHNSLKTVGVKEPVVRGYAHDITERKKAEELIRASEMKYRSLVEQASDGILVTDLQGIIVDLNSMVCKMSGYTREEVISKNASTFIEPHNLKEQPLRLNLLKEGESLLLERKAVRKDGTIFDIELNTRLIGENRAMSVIRDISERKKSEQLLRESEERYKALVENAPEALVVFDVGSKKFASVSESAEKLFKIPKQELLQFGPVELSPEFQPDGRLSSESANEKINLAIAGEKPSFEWTHCDKEGNPIPCEVRLVRLPSEEKLLIRGSIIDITERKKAEKAIKESEEKYRTLVEQASDPIVIYSLTGKMLDYNNAFMQVMGYQKEDIGKLKVTDMFFEKDLKEKPLVFGGLSKGYLVHDLRRAKRKDGSSILVELNSKMMPDGNIMVIGRDITERKKAEKELEDSYAAIRKLTEHLQNIREEERKHIAREIHDELGQQLTVMKMDISWINKRLATIGEDSIREKAKELTEMIDQTVKTIRRISSELRPSLLDDLGLIAAMEWQLHEFKRRSEIKTSLKILSGNIILPDNAKTGIFRIFQESLTNVARHSGAKKVDVVLSQKNDMLILSINDDGNGFDKEKIAGKKTLGILGMQERTSMIGGSYEISSQPGKGTSVVVTIPIIHQ